MPATTRRFYADVSVARADGGFQLQFDGRSNLTPGRRPALFPNTDLAEAAAREWRAQSEQIDTDSMPITRLTYTKLDRVIPDRAILIPEIARYAETDLLAHWSEEPPELAEQQSVAWHPILDWADKTLGIRLIPTTGIQPITHSPESLAAAKAAVEALDDDHLTAATVLTPLFASLILALAVIKGRLAADDAFRLSQLEETSQAARWGDTEERQARITRLSAEVDGVAHYLRLLGAR